jgi:hypothetical protein
MTNLSPAAQAVASAYDDTPEKETGNHRYLWLAAALRAAADQVVPPEQERLFNEERPWDGELCAVVEIRQEILAIAAELEAQ